MFRAAVFPLPRGSPWQPSRGLSICTVLRRSTKEEQPFAFHERACVVDGETKESRTIHQMQAEEETGFINQLTSAASGKFKQQNVGILMENTHSINYTRAVVACWKIGACPVPLSPAYPLPEQHYFVQDAKCSALITSYTPDRDTELRSALEFTQDEPIVYHGGHGHAAATQTGRHAPERCFDDSNEPADRSMILYTSGSTGRPKGVILSHQMVEYQTRTLAQIWDVTQADRVLHCLPLHHTHGVINALLCPLRVGATVEFLHGFNAQLVWDRLLSGDISVFMGVPTMYAKLLECAPSNAKQLRDRTRLLICGSAAMPTTVAERWTATTGTTLLERYGMTETGMVLSQPLAESKRVVGTVGTPLPGLQVRRGGEQQDELQVKGPIFSGYWRRDSTQEFTADGYFQTGDMVEYQAERDTYKILGRASVDFIKSGGYRIGALDIERVLLLSPAVKECTVIGMPDDVWGETITAVITPTDPQHPVWLSQLQQFCAPYLPKYKFPRKLVLFSDGIPRNQMGKVNKKQLKQQLLQREQQEELEKKEQKKPAAS